MHIHVMHYFWCFSAGHYRGTSLWSVFHSPECNCISVTWVIAVVDAMMSGNIISVCRDGEAVCGEIPFNLKQSIEIIKSFSFSLKSQKPESRGRSLRCHPGQLPAVTRRDKT